MPQGNYPSSRKQTVSLQLAETPLQRFYLAPIKGINTSVPEEQLNPHSRYVPSICNFLPTQRGTIQKRPGFEFIDASDFTNEFLEFLEWGDSEGTIRVTGVATDETSFSLHNIGLDINNDPERTEVSRGILSSSIGESIEKTKVFFALFGGSGFTTLIMTRGKDTKLNKYRPDDSSTVSNLETGGFEELSGNCILQQGGHLILGNIREQRTSSDDLEDYPYRLRWSRFGLFEDFTVSSDTTAGSLDLILDKENGPILSINPLREFMVVYKKNSIYNLSNRGGGVFYPELKCSDRGAIGPKAVAPIQDGNRHIVVSSDNIYIYDGFGFKYPPIGDMVKEYFYTRLDFEKADDVYVKSIPHRYECWIFFDSINPVNDWNTREALCWNWQRNSWTHHTLPAKCMVVGNDLIKEISKSVIMGISGEYSDGETRRGSAIAFTGNKDHDQAIEGIINYPIQALVGRDGEYKDHTWLNFVELDAYPLPNNSNLERVPGENILRNKSPLVVEDVGVYELKVSFTNSTVVPKQMEPSIYPFIGRTFSSYPEWEEKNWLVGEKCVYNFIVYDCIMEATIIHTLPPPNDATRWEASDEVPIESGDKHQDRVIFPCDDFIIGDHRYVGAQLICKSKEVLEEINGLGLENKYNPNPNQQ